MVGFLELRKFSNGNSEKNSKKFHQISRKVFLSFEEKNNEELTKGGFKTLTGTKRLCLPASEQGSTENANISRQNFVENYAEILLKGLKDFQRQISSIVAAKVTKSEKNQAQTFNDLLPRDGPCQFNGKFNSKQQREHIPHNVSLKSSRPSFFTLHS